jgi:hypothetical protein
MLTPAFTADMAIIALNPEVMIMEVIIQADRNNGLIFVTAAIRNLECNLIGRTCQFQPWLLLVLSNCAAHHSARHIVPGDSAIAASLNPVIRHGMVKHHRIAYNDFT